MLLKSPIVSFPIALAMRRVLPKRLVKTGMEHPSGFLKNSAGPSCTSTRPGNFRHLQTRGYQESLFPSHPFPGQAGRQSLLSHDISFIFLFGNPKISLAKYFPSH